MTLVTHWQHRNSICTLQIIRAIFILLAFSGSSICCIPLFTGLNLGSLHLDLEDAVSNTRPGLANTPPP